MRCEGEGDQIAARLGRGVGRVGLERMGLRSRSPRRSSRRPRRSRCARSVLTPARCGRRRSACGCRPRWYVTNSAPPSMERSTCDSAAKCTTCVVARPSASPTSSGSQMSPCTNANPGWSRTGVEVGAVTGVGQLVEHRDLDVARVRWGPQEQRTDVVRADEAGTAGHEDSCHELICTLLWSPSTSRCARGYPGRGGDLASWPMSEASIRRTPRDGGAATARWSTRSRCPSTVQSSSMAVNGPM